MDKTWFDDVAESLEIASNVVPVGPRNFESADATWTADLLSREEMPPSLRDALNSNRAFWDRYPMLIEYYWSASFDSSEPLGCLGGLKLRHPADCWSLRDDPDGRIPDPTFDSETRFLLGIDSFHGNGDFILFDVQAEEIPMVRYSSGFELYPLDVDLVTFYTVAMQCLGWPGWPFLFATELSDYHIEMVQRDMTAMRETLPIWRPDDDRALLERAVEDWFGRFR